MRNALIGGLVSIPLTAGLYWQSGMGNELSISMVFFGGLLAGYLAQRQHTNEENVGFYAGLVGGLPVLWIAFNLFETAIGPIGPIWFRMVAVVMTILLVLVSLVLSGAIGLVGSKVGRWLATKSSQHRTSTG